MPAKSTSISENLDALVTTIDGIIRALYKLERLRIETRDLMLGSTNTTTLDPLAMKVVARHLAWEDGVLYEAGDPQDEADDTDGRVGAREALARLEALVTVIRARPSMPASEFIEDLAVVIEILDRPSR